jgi:hypothetical protein
VKALPEHERIKMMSRQDQNDNFIMCENKCNAPIMLLNANAC